jgi:hypothetical protein
MFQLDQLLILKKGVYFNYFNKIKSRNDFMSGGELSSVKDALRFISCSIEPFLFCLNILEVFSWNLIRAQERLTTNVLLNFVTAID